MSPPEIPTTEPVEVVVEHPHLLKIVTVDLQVGQLKYIIKRLTDALKPVMSNARDTSLSTETQAHYKEQQRLILDLIVTLQQALDRKPEEAP